MKRTSSIALFSLFALTSLAPAAEDLLEAAPTTKDNISITLPKGWKELPHPATHTMLVAGPATRDSDPSGDYAPVLIIRAVSHTGGVDGEAQQANVAREVANYQITEKPDHTSINGLDAVTFGGTFTQGALKLRSRQYFILANDRLYSLTAIALASAWDQHVATLDAWVRTFAFVPKK